MKCNSWKEFQTLCSNPADFINDLKEFPLLIDEGKVPRKNIENVRKVQIAMGSDATPESLKAKSAAASSMCRWLNNICAYYVLAAPATVADIKTPAGRKAESDNNGRRMVNNLSKADLVELKSFAAPPATVKMVLTVVGLLLDNEEKDWKGCKLMLTDVTFLKRLLAFDSEQVTPSALARAKVLTAEPGFDIRVVKRQSMCGEGLALWVLDVLEQSGNNGGGDGKGL